MIQLSLEVLSKLSEADFRKRVLIPLFEAMGFHDIRERHGSEERGKDIVMWKAEEPLRERVDWAVVAKIGDIRKGPVADRVSNQVREALGTPYADVITSQSRSVDRVIVATTGSFTPQAEEFLRNQLESGQQSRVYYWDDKKVLELAARFLPNWLIWEPLDRAAKELNRSGGEWEYTVQLGPDGIPAILVSSRLDDSQLTEPIKGSFTPRFPLTPEGMAKRAELQKHFETGARVRLSEENLESFTVHMPEPFRSMMQEGRVTEVILGPSDQPLEEPLLLRLVVLDVANQELFSWDYLCLAHIQGGSREVTLDNRSQPIPFRFAVTLSRSESKASFSFDFKAIHANILQYRRFLQFQQAASQGARMVLVDWQSGLPMVGLEIPPGSFEPPPEELVNLSHELVLVQSRTGTMLTLGESAVFTPRDVQNARIASQAVSYARAELPGRISFSVIDREALPAVGESLEFPIEQEEFTVEILGVNVSLGPAHILCCGVLRNSKEGSTDPQFYIDATPERPFLAVFPKWFPSSDEGSSRAEVRPPEPQDEHQRDLVLRYPGLAVLVQRGRIRLGGPNRPEIYERMPAALEGVTSAELLDQDRGER